MMNQDRLTGQFGITCEREPDDFEARAESERKYALHLVALARTMPPETTVGELFKEANKTWNDRHSIKAEDLRLLFELLAKSVNSR